MKHYNRYTFLLIPILATILSLFSTGAKAKADTISYDNIHNIYTLTDEHGTELMKLQMENGIITMTANSAKATTGVRYETIGLAITLNKIEGKVSTLGYTGPDTIGSAKGGTAYVNFLDKYTKNDTVGDRVISKKEITVDQLENALGTDFDQIDQDQKIWLHCVFRTYNASNNSTRVDNIRSWYHIMHAEDWKESSLEGFYKYYNMYLKFDADKQPNSIVYEDEDGGAVKDEDGNSKYSLSSEYIGDKVKWTSSKAPATITKGDKVYCLNKYYITTNGSTKHRETTTLSDVDKNVSKLQNSYTTEKYRGVKVHLVYKVKYPNKIVYELKDSSTPHIRTHCDLDPEYVDTSVKWVKGESPSTTTYKGKKYTLVGYKITAFDDDAEDDVYTQKWAGESVPLSAIQSGSYKEREGGLEIHLIYDLVDESNKLVYETTNGEIMNSMKLADAQIGEPVKWSVTDSTYTYNNNTYTVQGYYVTHNSDTTEKRYESKTSDGTNVSSILSNQTTEVSGGVTVHIVYTLSSSGGGSGGSDNSGNNNSGDNVDNPEVPESDSVSAPLLTADSTGVIQADDRDNNKFDVTEGVPTTESLYTEVDSSDYLTGYSLVKKVGINTYNVKVSKTYTLKWKVYDSTSKKYVTKTEDKTVTQYKTIKRSYGYWTIDYFDCYKIGYATIYNYALPNGLCTMYPNTSAGYDIPNISISHSNSEDDHIIVPKEITDGITLSETIDGGSKKPIIPDEDITSGIDDQIPKLSVKSDSLVINGTTVMSSEETEWNAPDIDSDYLQTFREDGSEICNQDVLYQNNQIIDAEKGNGSFDTYGAVAYLSLGSVNSSYGYAYQNAINELTPVIIHTPVYCEVSAASDNAKYVQLLNPTDAVQAVLDPDSSYNDFTVSISNTGFHSDPLGYGTRDYSKSLRDENVSYIKQGNSTLRNEVKFPFDAYVLESGEYKYIPKNTWVVLGRSTATFHLPMWVSEGTYTVNCRTVAVNADDSKLNQTSEYRANTQLYNYVATDSFTLEVSGRIYGLKVYDITDYPIWQEVFRETNSLNLKINDSTYLSGTDKSTYSKNFSYDYAVGIRDQYGNDTGRLSKYTTPLVKRNHPYYINKSISKIGNGVRFKLNTIVSMHGSGRYVRIT